MDDNIKVMNNNSCDMVVNTHTTDEHQENKQDVPKANYAVIGGSSTNSIDFPSELNNGYVSVVSKNLIFDTPYGKSPKFTLFSIENKNILTCKMHGWRSGVTRADASRQIFWVFKNAGVNKILAEGGVGAINHLLNLRDIIMPTDYIDNSVRKDVSLGSNYLLIMRQAICPNLHSLLVETAKKYAEARIFERGIYAVTDGRHFESPAEVNSLKLWGADIVGQSLCPEVYLAREIGACYAGIYLVVNYAEGIVEDWKHEELTEIFYGESLRIGNILIDTLRALIKQDVEEELKNLQTIKCECENLRKPTLLKE